MSFTEEETQEIARRLKELRSLLRFNQREMAAKIGVSYSHYSKLEVGKGCLGKKILGKVAMTFGISEGWLMTGIGEAPTFPELAFPHCHDVIVPPEKFIPPPQKQTLDIDEVERILELASEQNIIVLANKMSETTGMKKFRALAILTTQIPR